MQLGRRVGEPCSERNLMAQIQVLVLARVQAQVVCPVRYVGSDSISTGTYTCINNCKSISVASYLRM